MVAVGTHSGSELRLRWVIALDAASTAVQAALSAHTLPSDLCVAEARLLTRERAWLEKVVWPSAD